MAKKEVINIMIKLFYLLFILCLAVACKSTQNNNIDLLSDDAVLSALSDSVILESAKMPIFFGFNFEMDSLDVISHLKEMEVWNFYDTYNGKKRKYLKILRLANNLGWSRNKTIEYLWLNGINSQNMDDGIKYYEEPELVIDYFDDSLTYNTRIVLFENDSSFVEKIVSFGLTMHHDRLRSITICVSGDFNNIPSEVNYEPLINSLVRTFSFKYGNPISSYPATIWRDGIVKITLKYDGIKKTYLNRRVAYYPYYIIKYENIQLESKIKNQRELERARRDSLNLIKQQNEQQELKNEFENSNIL